jgi:hypothetical protein
VVEGVERELSVHLELVEPAESSVLLVRRRYLYL